LLMMHRKTKWKALHKLETIHEPYFFCTCLTLDLKDFHKDAISSDDKIEIVLPSLTPEPMVLDLFAQRDKPKACKSIQCFEQWVICFNVYMTSRYPNRINDLLGYASLIAKVSKDYEGTPWLSYDVHFCKLAAEQLTDPP